MRRFLLISPYFPPVGVVGAKRALNLVRHLPARGFEPVVLTVPHEGEPLDAGAAEHVPEEIRVVQGFRSGLGRVVRRPRRARGAVERAGGSSRWQYVTPFDRYLWDVVGASRAGVRLVAQERLEAVVVNADPWSGIAVGLAIRRATGLPLVLDLRDPWSLQEAKMALRPAPTRAVIRRFEAMAFGEAARVILNTERAREAYVTAYAGRIPRERFAAIRNAFDRALYEPPGVTAEREPAARPFTVAYFGSFRRFVEPDALFAVFGRFVRAERLTPSQATLRIVGGLRPADREKARRVGIDGHLEVRERVPLGRTLCVLDEADVLALVAAPAYRLQIPAKLYDYLCASRPVLALSANPEIDAIVDETGAGVRTEVADVASGARLLARLYRHRRVKPDPTLPSRIPERIARYAAAPQADRVAGLLAEVLEEPDRHFG